MKDGLEAGDLAVGRLAPHDAQENPDDDVAGLDDQGDVVIRAFEDQHKRRAVDFAVPAP